MDTEIYEVYYLPLHLFFVKVLEGKEGEVECLLQLWLTEEDGLAVE